MDLANGYFFSEIVLILWSLLNLFVNAISFYFFPSCFSFRYSEYCGLGIMFIQHGFMLGYIATLFKNKEIVCLLGYRMRCRVHQIDTSCVCLLVKGRLWSGNDFQGFLGGYFVCVLFVLFSVGARYEGGMQHKRCFYTNQLQEMHFLNVATWKSALRTFFVLFFFNFWILSQRSATSTTMRRTAVEVFTCFVWVL